MIEFKFPSCYRMLPDVTTVGLLLLLTAVTDCYYYCNCYSLSLAVSPPLPQVLDYEHVGRTVLIAEDRR